MEFHPNKCKVLRITNKRRVIKYCYLLHNVILREVSNAKYCGKSIYEICGKANQTRQFLQRNLVACKPEIKLQCYKTFIRPIVEYSSSVWDPAGNNQHTKQIESVQGKAARWITIQKFLTKCIIPERTRYTDIRFKSIYGRVHCYNNSFIPYTVKQ